MPDQPATQPHRPLSAAELDALETQVERDHFVYQSYRETILALIADNHALRAALIAYLEPAGDTPEELRAQGRAALGAAPRSLRC